MGSSTFVMGNNCSHDGVSSDIFWRDAGQTGGGVRNPWCRMLWIRLMEAARFAFIHGVQACVGRWQQ